MNFEKNKALMKEEGITPLCEVKIKSEEVDKLIPKIEGVYHQRHSYKFINLLKQSIRLYPMLGGGLNQDKEFHIIIGLQNDMIDTEWVEKEWGNYELYLKKKEIDKK